MRQETQEDSQESDLAPYVICTRFFSPKQSVHSSLYICNIGDESVPYFRIVHEDESRFLFLHETEDKHEAMETFLSQTREILSSLSLLPAQGVQQ